MPQDKKPLGLTKPKKVPAKRIKEIADSLMRGSDKKKAFANTQEKIGSSLVKKGLGDKKQSYWDNEGRLGTIGKQKTMPTGKERLELAKKARQSASADSTKSVRLQNLIKNK